MLFLEPLIAIPNYCGLVMNIEFKRKRPTDRQGAVRKEVWNMKRRGLVENF